MVSRMSLLLFALWYALDWRCNGKDMALLDKICWCVMDMALATVSTFIRNVYLAKAFVTYAVKLEDLRSFREHEHRTLDGPLCCGEYLT